MLQAVRLRLIRRKGYIRINRHRLQYLNFREKINCAYCGYANGLMKYSAANTAATEKYWCGIKHRKYKKFG